MDKNNFKNRFSLPKIGGKFAIEIRISFRLKKLFQQMEKMVTLTIYIDIMLQFEVPT